MTTDPLVSTEWLAKHLHDKHVKVVDASFKMPGVMPLPKEDYERAHIPGAVFFDVDAIADHSNSLPHMFPDAEQFGRDVGALGSAMPIRSSSMTPAAGWRRPAPGGCSSPSATTRSAYSTAG